MGCHGFKCGTGTSSRVLPEENGGYTLGVLVQANYGIRPWLTILGVPVGKYLTEDRIREERELGSIIVVIATDAPMLPHQLQRVAKRGALGIGRCGSPGGNNSGDIFLAFSVANEAPLALHSKAHLTAQYINDNYFDGLYAGAVDSVEESIVNAMIAARDTPTIKNPADRICRAIPHQQLVDIMRRHGRCV